VDGPPGSLNDPTVVSEPRSTKGMTEAAGPFAQKAATVVQCRSVAEKPSTAVQAASGSLCRNDDTGKVSGLKLEVSLLLVRLF